MSSLLTLVCMAAVLCVPATARAQTSVESLLGLRAAGFSDELLIATFQSDGTVYQLTAEDLIYLRQQGISERVLIAMLATRRPAPAPVAPVPPSTWPAVAPVPDVVSRPDPEPRREPPVIVEVSQRVEQNVEVEAPRRSSTRTVYVPVPVTRREPQEKPEPVYWGFGGRARTGRVVTPIGSSGGGTTKPTGGGGL